MSVVYLKPIGSYPDVRKLAAESQGAIDESLNETGRWAKQKFEAIVSNWQHKPTFEIRRTRMTVSISVTGPNAQIWEFVDAGTRPHVIKAKGGGRRLGAKLLTFRTGGQAKTRPNNSVFKGGAPASGPWVSKQQVNHPGSKARNFTRIVRNAAIAEGRRILRANFNRRRLPL